MPAVLRLLVLGQNTIIDGEGTFLTGERGCNQILEMLLAAQERVIMMQVGNCMTPYHKGQMYVHHTAQSA